MNDRWVSAGTGTETSEAQWRVVGELLNGQATGQQQIIDTMQGRDIAPRIIGRDESPRARGLGFAITSGPFVGVIAMLVIGIVTLAFTGAQMFGWMMTGIGGLGLLVLLAVFAIGERNSPGAVDRRWAAADEHRSDNDTEVRLEMVRAERDIRLARLQVYRETQLMIGGGQGERKQISGSNQLPKQLRSE